MCVSAYLHEYRREREDCQGQGKGVTVRKAVKLGQNRKERETQGGRPIRLRILLPKVKPEAITVPTQCAYASWEGKKFYLRQQVSKPVRDTVYQEVQVPRYQCLRCKRTFRVYPEGTSRAQTSQRVKGLA